MAPRTKQTTFLWLAPHFWAYFFATLRRCRLVLVVLLLQVEVNQEQPIRARPQSLPARPFAAPKAAGRRAGHVYADDFVSSVDQQANKQCSPQKDNPLLLGYFLIGGRTRNFRVA
jgi:hypothetical protein